jgi:trehalose 6-phosphate synthase
VAALTPVLRRTGGTWVGWPGVSEQVLAEPEVAALLAKRSRADDLGFALRPVPVPEAEAEPFYAGFANSIVWPLFHDRQTGIEFDPQHYRAYRSVDRRFAAVAAEVEHADLVWVHDYHLFHVGEELRLHRPDLRIGWFLHTPFPAPDLYRRLPWRDEILGALLAYDAIGVQHRRDARNLIANLEMAFGPDIRVVREDGTHVVEHARGWTRIGVAPIGIDPEPWERRAQSRRVVHRVQELRQSIGAQRVVLGVDRLDESKGLLERLRAWQHLLQMRPDLRGQVVLVQIVVPSREAVPRYGQLKRDVERMVGEINGTLGTPSWAPVHHLYRAVSTDELTALYRLADVCVITSIKDGMNLVALEYCAAQVDASGALLLSEFAGAADHLLDAWVVQPHDREGTAAALVEALESTPAERRRRMIALRTTVRSNNVYAWRDRFLALVFQPRSVVAAQEPRVPRWGGLPS